MHKSGCKPGRIRTKSVCCVAASTWHERELCLVEKLSLGETEWRLPGAQILCKSKIRSEQSSIFNCFGIKNSGASKCWTFSLWDLLLCHTFLSLLRLDSSSLPPRFFSWEPFPVYYAEKTGLALFLWLKQRSYKLGMVTMTSGTVSFLPCFLHVGNVAMAIFQVKIKQPYFRADKQMMGC